MQFQTRRNDIDLVFEILFAIVDASNPADFVTRNTLKELKRQLLSEEAGKKEATRKAAEEFTLEETVMNFGLTYTVTLEEPPKYLWNIEALPDFKTFQPSECLVSVLNNYLGVYDRSCKAGCKVALDFILCECIAMRRETRSTEDGQRTRTPWDTVKVHCEVSFTHAVNPLPTIPNTIVCGRVDHGVAIVIGSWRVPNLPFHSLLLCVEAEFHGRVSDALPPLVVYLASLRQSRLNQGRSNASVYGLATDGLLFVFVTITREGVLKKSRTFDVKLGNLSIVLGCLQYILEMAMSMSPNLTPERDALNELEADGDDPIDLYDSPHLHSDDEFEQGGSLSLTAKLLSIAPQGLLRNLHL